jgi:hypothetical protein
MMEPLRPMSTGQLLDGTVALYRQHFLLFVGIATPGPAASVVFQLLTLGSAVVPAPGAHRVVAAGASLFLSMFVGYLILLAGTALAHAATVKAVAAVHLGRETSIASAYRALWGRIWRVMRIFFVVVLMAGFAAFLVAFVVAIVAVLVVVVAAVGAPRTGPTGAIAAGIVGFSVVGIALTAFGVVYVRYALAVQACVVEDLPVLPSLKRSVFLSKGSRWRVVAIYSIFVILSVIVSFGLTRLAREVGILFHSRIAALVLVYATAFVAGSLTGPLATIGLSLLYYDERVRKEAFDLQLMMADLDASAAPVVAPAQI